ncbi:TolC family protein [Flavobacterium piscinae]|uniref:TolC family protein n=1 Tax=Flavobacterium piscinae TaxID=2506424 RepID=A0A4Q1KNS1_9FLAO|nr:TolC family protein [Flavobacterium piscinae]MBC8883369.1 TolC family protein [Flavobacterium piscinae]RXR31527.1 TolC family protein [Flavobacterium piscinae]
MKKLFLFYLLPFIGIPLWSQNQPILTLEEAVALTLENNFDIRIAKNDLKIDEENVTIGNAGMLPRINGTVTNNNTILNQTQTQASGNEIEIDGARNININYGVGVEWTIFDGFRMFARHNQLKELQNLGATELKLSVLSRVSAVYQTYFTLATQQQQLKMIDSIISVSEFRLKTAKNRFTIGKASKLEVLNAEVDLNADQSTKIQLLEQYGVSKVMLNELLVRPLDTDFKVADVISIDNTLILPELLSSAEKQNPQLQLQYINKKIQEYELKQVKANRYPIISLSGGYNLIRSQSPFGFVTESTGRNFNYGFTASLNLFDGFNQNRNEKVAKIQLENTQLQIERQTQLIQSQVASLYQSYLSNLSLLELEKKNEAIAKQNMEITLEKFKIGSVAPIEFRTAQENYGNAVIRLTTAELLTKQSEISLKELAGSLTF